MLGFVVSSVQAAGFRVRANSANSDEEGGSKDIELQDHDLELNLDLDKDGKVSPKEMRANLKYLNIHLDILRMRLELEWAMSQMIVKLPNFFMCMICFVMALYLLSPANSLSTANQQLISHFQLSRDELKKISKFDEVYNFLEKFPHLNEEIMPLSPHFWCESRYRDSFYNTTLRVPSKSCFSPRFHALGLDEDDRSEWTAEKLVGYTAPDECADDVTSLRQLIGNSSITCEDDPSLFCNQVAGVRFCQRTCGTCAPFEYERSRKFSHSQFAILPVVVHQARMQEVPCQGFAEVFLQQASNEALHMLPALDGTRAGPIIQCVNPDLPFEKTWSDHSLSCPQELIDVGSPLCEDGIFGFSRKAELFGQTVYPKMILSPHLDSDALRAVDWLDVQTKSVTVSTFIYTQMDELFSSVSVTFEVDGSGRVRSNKRILSYRDLIGNARIVFTVALIGAIFFCSLGVAYPLRQMLRRRTCHSWTIIFEVISRTMLICYCGVLLFVWYQQRPMSALYGDLIRELSQYQSSSGDGIASDNFDSFMQTYLLALEDIERRTGMLLRFRIAAYILLYMQFIQLMLYFSFHPRMGVLTATVSKASSALAHFFALFGMLFMMLAFMAHWMLGTHIDEFETFGRTLASQARMLFGEFIYATSADEIEGTMLMMYWLYAFTFMLVVFFTLLNFFLAIIVDSFAAVKVEEKQNLTEKDFFNDCIDAPFSWLVYRMHKWPDCAELIHRLYIRRLDQARNQVAGGLADLEKTENMLRGIEDAEEIEKCSVNDFIQIFPEFKNKDKLAEFLTYYFLKCPVILSKSKRKINIFQAASNGNKEEDLYGKSEDTGDVRTYGEDDDEEEDDASAHDEIRWEDYLQEALALSPHLMGDDGPNISAGANIDWDMEALYLGRRVMTALRHYRSDKEKAEKDVHGLSKSDTSASDTFSSEPVPKEDCSTFLDRLAVDKSKASRALPVRTPARLLPKESVVDWHLLQTCSEALQRFSSMAEVLDGQWRLHNEEQADVVLAPSPGSNKHLAALRSAGSRSSQDLLANTMLPARSSTFPADLLDEEALVEGEEDQEEDSYGSRILSNLALAEIPFKAKYCEQDLHEVSEGSFHQAPPSESNFDQAESEVHVASV